MTHGSLFSGIGGFDLAAEWMGWENVFHCEINPFCQKVLKYHFPNSIQHDDITATDFSIYRGRIDVLTGGFPCQPFSAAGKRKGTEDSRHLWPAMLRTIQQIQPQWVVGENVFGITNWNGGLVFEQVQADLETEGYQVQPFVLPACGVNAPHRRGRIWFVANSKGIFNIRNTKISRESQYEQFRGVCTSQISTTSDTTSDGLYAEPTSQNNAIREDNKQSGSQRECATERFSESRITPNPCNQRLQGSKNERDIRAEWTKPDEQPTGLLFPNWQDFPTQSPLCSDHDGISARLSGITFPKHRNESIKAYGNAIVPQVVYQIFKVIQTMDNT